MAAAEWVEATGSVISGAGTLATFGVAIWALRAAREASRAARIQAAAATELAQREADRDIARQRNEAEQQAGFISAWCANRTGDEEYPKPDKTAYGFSWKDPVLWSLLVRNASDASIYRVSFAVMYQFQNGAVEDLGRCGLGDVPVVPPGLKSLPLPLEISARKEFKAPSRLIVAFAFTDTSGQRWRRDRNGILNPIVEGESAGPPPH